MAKEEKIEESKYEPNKPNITATEKDLIGRDALFYKYGKELYNMSEIMCTFLVKNGKTNMKIPTFINRLSNLIENYALIRASYPTIYDQWDPPKWQKQVISIQKDDGRIVNHAEKILLPRNYKQIPAEEAYELTTETKNLPFTYGGKTLTAETEVGSMTLKKYVTKYTTTEQVKEFLLRELYMFFSRLNIRDVENPTSYPSQKPFYYLFKLTDSEMYQQYECMIDLIKNAMQFSNLIAKRLPGELRKDVINALIGELKEDQYNNRILDFYIAFYTYYQWLVYHVQGLSVTMKRLLKTNGLFVMTHELLTSHHYDGPAEFLEFPPDLNQMLDFLLLLIMDQKVRNEIGNPPTMPWLDKSMIEESLLNSNGEEMTVKREPTLEEMEMRQQEFGNNVLTYEEKLRNYYYRYQATLPTIMQDKLLKDLMQWLHQDYNTEEEMMEMDDEVSEYETVVYANEEKMEIDDPEEISWKIRMEGPTGNKIFLPKSKYDIEMARREKLAKQYEPTMENISLKANELKKKKQEAMLRLERMRKKAIEYEKEKAKKEGRLYIEKKPKKIEPISVRSSKLNKPKSLSQQEIERIKQENFDSLMTWASSFEGPKKEATATDLPHEVKKKKEVVMGEDSLTLKEVSEKRVEEERKEHVEQAVQDLTNPQMAGVKVAEDKEPDKVNEPDVQEVFVYDLTAEPDESSQQAAVVEGVGELPVIPPTSMDLREQFVLRDENGKIKEEPIETQVQSQIMDEFFEI